VASAMLHPFSHYFKTSCYNKGLFFSLLLLLLIHPSPRQDWTAVINFTGCWATALGADTFHFHVNWPITNWQHPASG